jgi:hypothetical protein
VGIDWAVTQQLQTATANDGAACAHADAASVKSAASHFAIPFPHAFS